MSSSSGGFDLNQALGAVHGFGATVTVTYSVILALWGTYLYFRNHGLPGAFRSGFLIMGGLTAVQGLVGLAAFGAGGRPHELLHIVYGIFAVIFIPGAYLYSHGGSQRRETVILAGASWIVSIAYLRGIATG